MKTPFVLRTLGIGQGFMVAVTASRRCCAALVTTRSVGISWPFPAPAAVLCLWEEAKGSDRST